MKLSQRVIQNIQNTPNLPSLRYKNTCFLRWRIAHLETAFQKPRNDVSRPAKRRFKSHEMTYQDPRNGVSKLTTRFLSTNPQT